MFVKILVVVSILVAVGNAVSSSDEDTSLELGQQEVDQGNGYAGSELEEDTSLESGSEEAGLGNSYAIFRPSRVARAAPAPVTATRPTLVDAEGPQQNRNKNKGARKYAYAAPQSGRTTKYAYAAPQSGRTTKYAYAAPQSGRTTKYAYAAPQSGRTTKYAYAAPQSGRTTKYAYAIPQYGSATEYSYDVPAQQYARANAKYAYAFPQYGKTSRAAKYEYVPISTAEDAQDPLPGPVYGAVPPLIRA